MSATAYEYWTDWFDLQWNELPWSEIQDNVWKLQTRIYRAIKEGKQAEARRLQRLVLSSVSAVATFNNLQLLHQHPKVN